MFCPPSGPYQILVHKLCLNLLYFSFLGDLISPAFLDIGVGQTQQNLPFLSSFKHSSFLSLFRDKGCVERVLEKTSHSRLAPSLPPWITGFKIQISNKTVSASQRKSGKSAFSQWLSPNAVYSDGIYLFIFVWGTTWHIVKYPNLSGRELGGIFTYIPVWPAPSGEDFKHFHYPGCSFMLLPSQYSPPSRLVLSWFLYLDKILY